MAATARIIATKYGECPKYGLHVALSQHPLSYLYWLILQRTQYSVAGGTLLAETLRHDDDVIVDDGRNPVRSHRLGTREHAHNTL